MPVITIDGPAASGKGTIASGVAQALGFHLLDSGALYRLVALKAIESGVALDAAVALGAAAGNLDAAFADRRIRLEGRDVTDRIRDEDVGAAASQVAVHGGVRTALLERQRAFCAPRSRGRRPRHGDGGLSRRPAEGVFHGQPGGAGEPAP